MNITTGIIAFVYRLRIFTKQILEAWSALANNHTTHIERLNTKSYISKHHYLSTMILNFFPLSLSNMKWNFFQLMKNRLKKSNSFRQINFQCRKSHPAYTQQMSHSHLLWPFQLTWKRMLYVWKITNKFFWYVHT